MVPFPQILKSQVHCLAEDDVLESSSIICPEVTGTELTAQCAVQVDRFK